MSTLYSIQTTSEAACMKIVAAQWAALGKPLSPERAQRAQSIVDPEALLLTSLYVSPFHEPVRPVLAWWIETGIGLTSIRRVRRTVCLYPAGVRPRLAKFAAAAARSGHPRWKALTSKMSDKPSERRRARSPAQTPGEPATSASRGNDFDLLHPAALVLRLRQLFGVQANADIIAYLLGRCGEPSTIREISDVTGHSRSTIGPILHDLVRAGVAWKSTTYPKGYSVEPDAWHDLLGPSTIRKSLKWQRRFRRSDRKLTTGPTWPCWSHILSYLSTIHAASSSCLGLPDPPTTYDLSGIPPLPGEAEAKFQSKIRLLTADYRWIFYVNRVPRLTNLGQGEEYVERFDEELPKLASWCEEHV